eukprot:CAMPEP_0205903600 /NCGR_PEP_ID=MMETSP1325-20131115/206_1 /ASSEMBLY_ACC=CAM_ASM_000708 /TAXON_ID=236786 /ORGANISM="Florenciella sp., Strain RCC1007" /LENGTH=322 /DNA_ID=CAMNT_0053269271 /DNA_START=77 /DNA_END=1045 /DNA_ORIENTATION=-
MSINATWSTGLGALESVAGFVVVSPDEMHAAGAAVISGILGVLPESTPEAIKSFVADASPEGVMLAIASWLSLEVIFWVFAAWVHFMCYRWKIVGSKILEDHNPPDSLVQGTVVDLLKDHLIVHPLVLWYVMPIVLERGWLLPLSAPLPSVADLAWQLPAFLFINDTMFYWVHRAMHHKLLYKHFHKKHHEYYVSVSIAAEYSGIVEAVLADAAPLVAGPLLIGAYYKPVHGYTWCLWLFLRIWQTADAHCGYVLPWWGFGFPFLSDVLRHNWHHSKNNGNYGGATVFWDTICGTDTWLYTQREIKAGLRDKNGKKIQQKVE